MSLFILETQIKENLNNPAWFLRRLNYFGSLVASLKYGQLQPNPLTNFIFSNLVILIREFPEFDVEKQLLSLPQLRMLRPIVIKNCAIAEYQLEKCFAHSVISGEKKLNEFLYYDNYESLIKFEIQALKSYLGGTKFANIRKIAFIGSGPLPLSSIVLLQHFESQEVQIINFDQDLEAIKLGERICKDDFLEISFVHCTGSEIEDLNSVDIVYLAALAGLNQSEKQAILSNLHQVMKPGGVLIARSSFGLRTFIYHRINKNDLGQFVNFQQFDPWNNKNIINSVALAMKQSTDSL